MKMLKRLTACILTVMLMSMMFVISASAAAELPGDNTGTLTLRKYAEDSNMQTPVTGAVFTAYEVMELDRTTGKYTVTENFKNVPGISLEGELQLQGLTYESTDQLQEMVDTLHNYVLASSVVGDANGAVYESKETVGTPGEYTFTGMDLGIYLVVETKIPEKYTASSQSFLVAIPEWDNTTETWNASVTAYPKNKPIDIVKSLTDAETDYQIGDSVGFTITSDVPKYGDTVQNPEGFVYDISDTMSAGLTFDEDTLDVKVAGKSLSKGTDYTINTESTEIDGATFKLTFPWGTINQYQGQQIVVTYNGILNEKAVVGDGEPKNSNKAKLTYTHSFTSGADTDEITTTEVDVYTYGMILTKNFNNAPADGNEIDASDVEFSMTKDGAEMYFAQKTGEPGVYTVYTDDMGTLSGYSAKTTALNPSSTGVLKINGLDAGTYTLTEEKSLEGYSKLAGPVTITVTAGAGGEGNVSATVAGSPANINDDNAGIFEFTVNNVSKQFDLPLTGGTGLLIFTIGGGVVMAAAIIIFSQLRKKKSAK